MSLQSLCKLLPSHLSSHTVVQHALHKRFGVCRTHAHRLCASQIKAAHHRRLVGRCCRLVRVSQGVRELHDQLDKAVGRAPDRFDRFFAELCKKQVAQLIGADGGLKRLCTTGDSLEQVGVELEVELLDFGCFAGIFFLSILSALRQRRPQLSVEASRLQGLISLTLSLDAKGDLLDCHPYKNARR